MLYNNFKNKKLSALGMGCMRFPVIEKNDVIDIKKTEEMVKYALDNGINYFDTAWGYHGGNSERVIGSILKKYPRDSYYLATKFPGFDPSNFERPAEIFEEQLRKCQTEYFDFYLFHNVWESNIDNFLDEKFGVFKYLMQQKENGRIRHLGFSTHGKLPTIKRFLDAYGEHLEFCQIQLNWLDWDFQEAKEKVKLLNEKNIPIWVMEPVRGGALCNLAPKYKAVLNSAAPERTLPEWAFRYLQSLEGVTMILSGMSDSEQLKQNINTFSEYKPLSESEIKTLYDVSYEMTHSKTLPCTSCRYCTDRCPQKLNIPWLIGLYNEHTYSAGGYIAEKEMEELADSEKPSACIGCKACEEVCPQNIKISEMMADFALKIK